MTISHCQVNGAAGPVIVVTLKRELRGNRDLPCTSFHLNKDDC